MVLLVAAPLLAGCAVPGGLLSPAATVPVGGLLAQQASLWPDHQNEPHPLFGWPTLTHPALAGGAVPAWWQPIPAANVTGIHGLEPVAKAPAGLTKGGGAALFGSLAVVPGDGEPTSIVDIRDPTSPKLLSQYKATERGAAIMAMPDGRLFALVSTSAGFDVVNITDPTMPEMTAQAKGPHGGHKIGLVPGTPIVYNAHGGGTSIETRVPGQSPTGTTDIWDVSDPANPVMLQDWTNGYGCHHIFFWIDASKDKERAICAGFEATQIWDIKDPRHPTVVSTIPFPHGDPRLPSTAVGAITFSHTAFLNLDGTILIVGDELMGGGPSECDGTGQGVSGPLGALWFFDVKDEKNPKMLGWFSPPPSRVTSPPHPATFAASPNDAVIGCTAHHGRLVPDPEGKRQLLVMAWYGAGVLLVDFTDPAHPSMLDEWNPGTNTWEAWYDNGYVITGDLARGMDVLKLK